MYRQIGILTGGGDAPGLNAVIRAAVRTAVGEFGMKCIGIEDSFEGILGETQTMKLTTKSVHSYRVRVVAALNTKSNTALRRPDRGITGGVFGAPAKACDLVAAGINDGNI